MWKRLCFFAYGIGAYVLSAVTSLYLVGFVGNWLVTKSIDHGTPRDTDDSVAMAACVDIALVAAFGIQHSIMARPWFKAQWQRIVPEPIERSTFLMATVAVLQILFWQWRPIGGNVWQITAPLACWGMHLVSLSGWGLMLYSSVLIDHWELFGIRQVTCFLHNQPYTPSAFRERSLYKRMRHPLMTGVLLGIWATPTMSVGHLVFALAFTVYIGMGVALEERDLSKTFGASYDDYRRRTRKFLPIGIPPERPGRKRQP